MPKVCVSIENAKVYNIYFLAACCSTEQYGYSRLSALAQYLTYALLVLLPIHIGIILRYKYSRLALTHSYFRVLFLSVFAVPRT